MVDIKITYYVGRYYFRTKIYDENDKIYEKKDEFVYQKPITKMTANILNIASTIKLLEYASTHQIYITSSPFYDKPYIFYPHTSKYIEKCDIKLIMDAYRKNYEAFCASSFKDAIEIKNVYKIIRRKTVFGGTTLNLIDRTTYSDIFELLGRILQFDIKIESVKDTTRIYCNCKKYKSKDDDDCDIDTIRQELNKHNIKYKMDNTYDDDKMFIDYDNITLKIFYLVGSTKNLHE